MKELLIVLLLINLGSGQLVWSILQQFVELNQRSKERDELIEVVKNLIEKNKNEFKQQLDVQQSEIETLQELLVTKQKQIDELEHGQIELKSQVEDLAIQGMNVQDYSRVSNKRDVWNNSSVTNIAFFYLHIFLFSVISKSAIRVFETLE